MTVDLILYCEDPTFGVRGSRKFWALSYDSEKGHSVQTRWGRIPDGREVNIKWVHGQQHKSVPHDSEEKAIKFIDKKAMEKQAKGYKVAVHIVDGTDISLIHGSAAAPSGLLKMQTRSGT
jgi:predicted DNA-binding WGR domain protein